MNFFVNVLHKISANDYWFVWIIVSVIFGVILYHSGIRLMIIASGSMTPAIDAGSLVLTFPQQRYYPGQVISYHFDQPTSRNNAEIIDYGNFIETELSHNINSNSNLIAAESSLIVTHRVVSTLEINNQLYYRTKGDANDHFDLQLIEASHVIGRVWLVVPLLGFILLPFYHSFSRVLLGISIFYLVLLSVIKKK